MCKTDFKANVDAGADKKKLEHEVVKGFLEEFPIRSPLGWLLSVGTEVVDSLVKVDWSKTLFQVCLQLFGKFCKTYRMSKQEYLQGYSAGSQGLPRMFSFGMPQSILLDHQSLFKVR
jgi:hypothetical protein